MIIDRFMTQVQNSLPTSIKSFLMYPAVLERLEVITENLFVMVIFLLSLYFLFHFSRIKVRVAVIKIIISLSLLVNFIVRVVYGYTYDSAFSAFFISADFLCLTLFSLYIGTHIYRSDESTYTRIFNGLALCILGAVVLVLLRVNNWFTPVYFKYVHGIVTGLVIYTIWWMDIESRLLKLKANLNIKIFAILGLISLPLLPYIFTPSPPDADIVTMSDIMGYLFQGFSMSRVESGLIGEYFSIRYPIGLPALGWFGALLLNVRASEILTILWVVSFVLFNINMIRLGKLFGVSSLIISIFCLHPLVIGPLGLHGGQVPKMLTYTLGIHALISVIGRNYLWGSIALAAGIVINPIVIFPFLLIIFVRYLSELYNKKMNSEMIWCMVLLLSACFYLFWLGYGEANTPSTPIILLRELNIQLFLTNILKYAYEDSMGFPWVLFVIPVLFVLRFQDKRWQNVMVWLLGAMIIDGLFGHTKWGSRFQAVFSTVGIWILSSAFIVQSISELKFKQIGSWGQYVSRVLLLVWLFYALSNISFMPSSVFTSHSDIKLARYIEKNIPSSALIMNIRPPFDIGGDGLGFMVRGNSTHNVINERLGPHQIKDGNLVDRSIYGFCNKSNTAEYTKCLKEKGVTHLFIAARPGTKKYVENINTPILKSYGQSYLIAL